MTTSDVDRMHRDLNQRLGARPHRRRTRLVLVAAAVLLLVAAAVGGTIWLRRPAPEVPATPQSPLSLTGLWKISGPGFSNLLVHRADGTVRDYGTARNLVLGLTLDPFRVTTDGRQVQAEFTNEQGQVCRSRAPILAQSDGLLEQGAPTFDGPGCAGTSGASSTVLRLSPASPAGRAITAQPEGAPSTVTDAVQIDGVWLLQGTGLVLAVDEKSSPAAYLLDGNGDIDSAPDGKGAVDVTADAVVLRSPGCDVTLTKPEVRGGGATLTFTAAVGADPCGRFQGHDTLTWVRVL